jgi:hypothetical protein
MFLNQEHAKELKKLKTSKIACREANALDPVGRSGSAGFFASVPWRYGSTLTFKPLVEDHPLCKHKREKMNAQVLGHGTLSNQCHQRRSIKSGSLTSPIT